MTISVCTKTPKTVTMAFDPIICRSCLKANREMINLFSELDCEDFQITLSDCFNICTNIKIENDNSGMPDTICENCLAELKVAFSFRSKCEKSDYMLRNQLLKTNVKYEITENYGQQMIIEVLTEVSSQEEIEYLSEEQDNSNSVNDHMVTTKWLFEKIGEKNDDINDHDNNDEIEEFYLNDDNEVKITDNRYITTENDIDEYDNYVNDDDIETVMTNPRNSTESPIDTSNSNDEAAISGDFQYHKNIKSFEGNEKKNSQICSTIDDGGTNKKNWFECEECRKEFKLKSTLEKHMQTVHGGKALHLCNLCGKMCSNDASLESHILQHKGERPYECNQCQKTYFTKNGLSIHQSVHANKKPDAKYLCSTCGKGFTTNQRLRIHTYTHTGERNFPCNLCDKSFATESRLRCHRRTHTGERPYECDECGLTFAQGNALKCHKRVHTGEKPYVCKFCNKRFTQNTILKTHMTLHTGKTVKCPDCDKKFSRASYLILHRREHTGEKPYVCDRCPNRYKQKSHLDRHIDTHLGVKHRCEICGKEYSKQWSLKMHMFVHADEKPFNCNQCAISFIRKDKYKSHLKLHHEQNLIKDEKELLVIDGEDDEEPSTSIVQIECDIENENQTNVKPILPIPPLSTVPVSS